MPHTFLVPTDRSLQSLRQFRQKGLMFRFPCSCRPHRRCPPDHARSFQAGGQVRGSHRDEVSECRLIATIVMRKGGGCHLGLLFCGFYLVQACFEGKPEAVSGTLSANGGFGLLYFPFCAQPGWVWLFLCLSVLKFCDWVFVVGTGTGTRRPNPLSSDVLVFALQSFFLDIRFERLL